MNYRILVGFVFEFFIILSVYLWLLINVLFFILLCFSFVQQFLGRELSKQCERGIVGIQDKEGGYLQLYCDFRDVICCYQERLIFFYYFYSCVLDVCQYFFEILENFKVVKIREGYFINVYFIGVGCIFFILRCLLSLYLSECLFVVYFSYMCEVFDDEYLLLEF